MDTIKQLTANVQAKIKYEIPTEGSFIFAWVYRDMPFSATYKWTNGELEVMTDTGWEIAGHGGAEDYYGLHEMREVVAGQNGVTKFIACITVEVQS